MSTFETTFLTNKPLKKYLLKPKKQDDNRLTLVLDIDETLISVSRWIDELLINDKIFYKNNIAIIKNITKEIYVKFYDNNGSYFDTFYFNKNSPFGPFKSPINTGDEITIQSQMGFVERVCTTKMTIITTSNNEKISINITENILNNNILSYYDNFKENKFNKFKKVDYYDNKHVVRFRPYLDIFLYNLTKKYEIILWTAAIRQVYKILMNNIHKILINKLINKNIINNQKNNIKLWNNILYRDNCKLININTNNFYYLKDISLLGRQLSKIIIIDNIFNNFKGYELNGLPIYEYYPLYNNNDKQLLTLLNLLNSIYSLNINSIKYNDIRNILHSVANNYNFSTQLISLMLKHTNININNYNNININDLISNIDISNINQINFNNININEFLNDYNYINDDIINNNTLSCSSNSSSNSSQ